MGLLRNKINKIKESFQPLKYYIYNHFVANFPCYKFRIFYLKNLLGYKIGKETFIHMGCFFEGTDINIGNNTVIGRNCYIGGGPIHIGNNVSITAQTYMFAPTHYKDSPNFECYHKEIIIEDYAWIGARAVILPGVKIGKGSILGANSTATKNIPEYSVFVGSPAKEVSKRTKNLEYNLKYFPSFN